MSFIFVRRYTSVLLAMFVLLLLTAPIITGQAVAPVPQIVLAALEVGDTVRYTASFLKPLDLEVGAAYFEIVLPPTASESLVQTFETTDTRFAGVRRDMGGIALIWTANALTRTSALDTLTFTLETELIDDLTVYVEYTGNHPGTATVTGKPVVEASQPASEGELTLTSEGTGSVLLPVGPTGVRVGAAPGLLPADTLIRARQLPPDQNPPADLTTAEGEAFWWCSLVQIDGLPADTSLPVQVPARRPMAAFTTVRLFSMQADGTWRTLDTPGVVTADGQFIQYLHPGGIIAAGVVQALQPQPVETISEVANDVRRGMLLDSPSNGDPTPDSMTLTDPLSADVASTDDGNAAASDLQAYPSCAVVMDATTPCRIDEGDLAGALRVCQPGLIQCTFVLADGQVCYRPSVPYSVLCSGS